MAAARPVTPQAQHVAGGVKQGHAPPEPQQPTLAEIFPETAVDGAATGFALAHLRPDRGPVLWVQDRVSRHEAGVPCLAGMPAGLQVLTVAVSRAADALRAMEEGLRCTALCGVIGEIWGDAPALDFTATKRLALRAEAHGVPLWLIRRAATPDLSAARERWRIASLPSLPVRDDMRAPGAPQWRAELFRARWRTPGHWVARHDPATQGLVLDHGMATDPGGQGRAAAGAGSRGAGRDGAGPGEARHGASAPRAAAGMLEPRRAAS